MAYKVKDAYFLKAKKAGYRARSAFKLLGIQEKFNLLKPGQTVVDLGSAPGSFLQVISKIIGKEGRAIGIDIQEMNPLDEMNVILLQGNIYQEKELLAFFKAKGYGDADVVTSDLAPKTSGIRDADAAKSTDLTHQAYVLASALLKDGGSFVGKVFQGEELNSLLEEMRPHFKKVTVFKPKAVRSTSREIYVVAMGFKKR